MTDYRLGTTNRRSNYYQRFSPEEFERRWTAVREMMRAEDLDALVVYGNAGNHQPNIYYLTNYRPPFATYLVFFADPMEASTLFVGVSNHLQYVREVAEVGELRLMLPDPGTQVADRLQGTAAADGTVGVVGADPRYRHLIPHEHHQRLDSRLDADLVDATASYTRLTSVRSDEEIELVKTAAALVDEGVEALAESAASGVSERQLGDELQAVYLHGGGEVRYSWISSAPMEGAESGEPLPWKMPSARKVDRGDVITTEISAAYRGYKSQVHRPFAVGEPPTEVYQDIYDVAEETYWNLLDAVKPGNTARDVYEALSPVEESDYKSYDVMFHGYGGAYSHPFVGTRASNYWPNADDPLTADWTFEENMVMVLQPNVFTPDERHGLQLGTTVVVRSGGPEVLQEYPLEFGQV